MRVFVVEPPEPIVSYEDAVARLRLGGGEDERIDVEAMIAGATNHIDGPDGWLGRAIGPQTLEARFDSFDQWQFGSILLPYQPVIDLVSLRYVDSAGVEQTIDASGYDLLGREVVPAYNQAWPTARGQREAVRVRYRAGYAADPAGSPLVARVPAAITTAILLMVGDLYENRDTTSVSANTAVIPMSTTVENLLHPFRIYQ